MCCINTAMNSKVTLKVLYLGMQLFYLLSGMSVFFRLRMVSHSYYSEVSYRFKSINMLECMCACIYTVRVKFGMTCTKTN